MRVKLLFSALAFATFAHAQTVVTGPEALVQNGYDALRRSNDLFLEMYATDVRSGSTSRVHATLYWRVAYDARTRLSSLAQAELDVYDVDAKGADILHYRIVGDGVALHRYDATRHEVSTTAYGFYGVSPVGTYSGSDAPGLLGQLRAATPGLSAYLVRLLEELNPTGPTYDDPNRWIKGHPDRYADWVPGRANLLFDQVPNPIRQGAGADAVIRDPISKRLYVQSGDQWLFSGMDRTDTDRTVVFQMSQGEDGQYTLARVNVAQRTAVRFVDLAMVPSATTAPAWAYAPYTGAQAAAFRPIAARI